MGWDGWSQICTHVSTKVSVLLVKLSALYHVVEDS